MNKPDIQSRADIEILIRNFYQKVRRHTIIGTLFNEVIDDWEEHILKLTDFWQTNLFFVKAYKGNPLKAHIRVDQQFGNSIEQAHFGHWLQLWFETLDQLYEGKNATLAKERARSMAHIMYLRIFQARKEDRYVY